MLKCSHDSANEGTIESFCDLTTVALKVFGYAPNIYKACKLNSC